ncbi:UNVERIFIED_CONTAM: Trimethylguanosine synthase [Sesamum calycinum]|uniref:Trimethylguanosine synthase n=1 Tax=Sesamum calycinum TaxID=2727403 RepID=A0AAW2PLM4_9LAMI
MVELERQKCPRIRVLHRTGKGLQAARAPEFYWAYLLGRYPKSRINYKHAFISMQCDFSLLYLKIGASSLPLYNRLSSAVSASATSERSDERRLTQYNCIKLKYWSRMSPAKDSGVAFSRTRKQRKRFKRKVKIKAKRRAQKLEKLKERENVTPLVKKYWLQRYDLFSMYDVGVKLDEEGWFSVTPEEIAARQAERCAGAGVVIDAFAGVGGNAIQFAKVCHRVVAVDVDPNKVQLAFHNAKIYGVEDYIDFIVGDFFQLAPFLKAAKRLNDAANLDCVTVTQWFTCCIWHLGGCSVSFTTLGGPSYKAKESFTLDLLKPKDGHSLFQVAQAITPNIIMYLPRNLDMLQANELSWLSSPPLDVVIEENFVRGNSKGLTLYFGDTAFTGLSM